MYILHLFFAIVHFTTESSDKKGMNGPNGMHVRDTSSPSCGGVTGLAKSLSQSPSLLCGTAVSLPAVSSSPHKTPSQRLLIWTVSWHLVTVSPKHSYKVGKAQVTHFTSSDTAHSILPIHINSSNSAEAEWQLLHQEEQELGCSSFLTLLEDQVAPSSKLRLLGCYPWIQLYIKLYFRSSVTILKLK